MARNEHRILFTALGFLSVILRDDLPRDKQASRATSIAQLIESFCITSVPDAFEKEKNTDIKQLVADYVTGLRVEGSAVLDYDRQTLLQMYELMTAQKLRHDQKEFYAFGNDDIIASKILRLAEEQIGWEG